MLDPETIGWGSDPPVSYDKLVEWIMSGEQNSTQKVSVEDLALERVKFLVDQIKSVVPHLDELANLSDEVRNQIERQIGEYALSIRTTKLKPEELDAFFKKPYKIQPVPGREQTWQLHIPKFIDVQLGWLESEDESYRTFLINRYVEWLGGLPDEIKRQLGFKPPPDLYLDGEILTGPPRALEEAWTRYRPLLRDRDEKQIIINKRRSFELLAALIKDGVLPFTPKPVDPSDLVSRSLDFKLRPYQEEAWRTFLKYSNIGVFYPASTGKTILGLYLMTHLKGPHLVVVPTRLLVEQWEERIQAHTDLKPGEYVVATYHTAIKKLADKEWSSLIVDEVHHLPADQFSKLSFIKRKYTVGLSATPQREDKREEYIFALTGFPVGLGWEHFKQLGLIKSPVCHVWILKNFEAKLARLKALIDPEVKTLIFSDSIEVGKTIAKRFDLPHIYGETKDGRLETIEESPVTVVSRVADEGVSLPTVGKVIEVNWLYGSRRQELQRFTRLLHGFDIKSEGEHHVLMTLEEYIHDRKRLFSVMDKGFKVEIHREGVSERAVEQRLTETWQRPRRRPPAAKMVVGEPPAIQAPAGPISGILELPGVKRIMSRLSKAEQRFYSMLLQNDGSWFKREQLPLLLGYTSDDSMRGSINFPKLVSAGYIEQSRVEGGLAYRTNVRARVG